MENIEHAISLRKALIDACEAGKDSKAIGGIAEYLVLAENACKENGTYEQYLSEIKK